MVTYHSLQADVAEVGLPAMMVYALGRALSAAKIGSAAYYAVMAVDLSETAKSAKDPPRLTCLDISNASGAPLDASMDIALERFAKGASCYLLSSTEGRQQATIWARESVFEEDEFRSVFLLPTAAVWDFGVYVLPALRTSRALHRLWAGFAALMVERGVHQSISRINVHNRPSLRAHKRLAHTDLGKIVIIRIGPLQIALSSFKPKVHMSVSRRRVPIYDLKDL